MAARWPADGGAVRGARATSARNNGNQRSTRRRVVAVGVIALLALLLPGCSRVSFSSQFREDGTATHEVEVVFERGSILATDLPTVQREIDAAEQRARDDGFATTRIDTATQIGLRITDDTLDAVDAGAALNNIFNSLAGERDDGPIAPFVGTFEKRGEAVGGTVYELEMTVDGPVLASAVQQVAPGNRQFATTQQVAEVVAFSYRATMPGDVKRSDGVEVGPSSVAWELPLTDVTTLSASSTVGRDTPWFWVGLTIVAALAVVAIAGRGIIELLLRRRRRAAQPAFEPAAGTLTPAAATSLADVRAALTRLVQRLASGSPLSAQPPEERSKRHGAEPEGD